MVGKMDTEFTRDEDDNLGITNALENFAEAEEVINLIDNLRTVYKTPEMESQYDKLSDILKHYYSQPHLLDPHLETILSKFLTIIKDPESPVDLKHATFAYMYQIVRVRGYKVVIRHLPHEVTDFQQVLTFLEDQDPKDMDTWRSRFVLLLWLSIVVIIPFHMSRLDGFTQRQEEGENVKKKSVMERVFELCKTYALTSDACSIASAYLTSKFLIRSDVKEIYMGPYFEWACQMHSNIQEETTIKYGVLAAVAAVLKHGKRDDLLPYANKLLNWVTSQNYRQHKAILVRKFGVKILQRIGLTYLKPRVAAFRYTQGSRSLAVTLGGASVQDASSSPAAQPDMVDDDQDIPQEVEEVVELLLCWLRDDDTVVRWSAAKGVGRVSARLPPLAAADVAESALALFAEHEKETAWHGGCMALAELARRGLLSPAQLGAGVEAVTKALRRDEARAAGAGGGGQPARDSACHAAWAFARAYDADALRPHAIELANALIATAVFDREINCRRAASAAYQENVGRHGMFPHGIDVLILADFQSVGPRTNAYLQIAPKIAEFPEYTQPLVDHLVDLKVEHWDCTIRELAAKALHKLVDKIPEYIAKEALPKLVKKIVSIDLNVRHGAILAIGEVFHALSLTVLPNGKKADTLIPESVLTSVRELVPSLYSRQQFRGLGGELMRAACCQCIAGLARAGVQLHGLPVIDDWLNLLEDCLSHEVQSIREKAVIALPLVFNEYLQKDDLMYNGVSAKEKRQELVARFCVQLGHTGSNNGMILRMGHARAIGLLPQFVLRESLSTVIPALIDCTKVTPSTAKWTESRRDAVTGMTDVCQSVGVKDLCQGESGYLREVFDALLVCLDEYTLDNRGDIGAWVREASMTGVITLCKLCAVEDPSLNSAEIVGKIMSLLAQQSVERIDRTRAHAGKTFTAFLYNEPQITNIPHHEALKKIFPFEETLPKLIIKDLKESSDGTFDRSQQASESSAAVLWLFPGHTMPRFVQLLDFDVYRYNVIKGLVVSAGDLTESLVKHTTQSLYAYLNSLHENIPRLVSFCDTVLKVFSDNLHNKRIIGPIFNFLDGLLSSGALSPILEDKSSKFASEVLRLTLLELRGSKNIYKLLDSVNVLCQLIQVGGDVCSRALVQLSIYLCYADSYVRRSTATRAYEALLLYGDLSCIPQDNLEQVMQVLADTDWEKEVTELRLIRNDLCDLMGVRKPVSKTVQQKPA